MQCSSCGANISRGDHYCPYCGAENPQYELPVAEVDALLEKGMKAYQADEFATAVSCYRRAVLLDPDVFNAYFYLASSLSALGKQKEAIETMKQARSLNPSSAAVHYNLGLLYKQTGQGKAARKSLTKALAVVATDTAVQNPENMKRLIKQELAALR